MPQETAALEGLLRITGASLMVLSALHAVFWQALGWRHELEALTPLTRRVFLVHTGVVASVLLGLGLLSLGWPELLLQPSGLARGLLVGTVILWGARLLAQPLIFAPVMQQGWAGLWVVRSGTTLVWLGYLAVYGGALLHQLGGVGILHAAPWPADSALTWLRAGIAAVWFVFGLVFKLMDAVPRHRAIVARVVGAQRAQWLLPCVALGEMLLGCWMLWGQHLVPCAVLQTAAIASMNALELTYARDLLVAPRAMLCLNACLLGAVWAVALGP